MRAWGNYAFELKYIRKVSLCLAGGKRPPQGTVTAFPLFLTGISLSLIQFKNKNVLSPYSIMPSHAEEGVSTVQSVQFLWLISFHSLGGERYTCVKGTQAPHSGFPGT